MKYTRYTYVDTAKDEWNSMLRTVADPRPTSMTSTTRTPKLKSFSHQIKNE